MVAARAAQRNGMKDLLVRLIGRPTHHAGDFLVVAPHRFNERSEFRSRMSRVRSGAHGINHEVGRERVSAILIEQGAHF